MTAKPMLSRVASPRECDMRQLSADATHSATDDAKSAALPGSLRELARDTLMRHQRDKVVARATLTLVVSINRCCDARGDDNANRVALIAECEPLPPAQQAEWREHFDTVADRYEAANRGEIKP